jgi:hypothetical protein
MSRSTPALKIRAIKPTAVNVPMTYALGTSRQRITTAPLLLIDLLTEEGVTGRSYLFCYLPAAAPAIIKILEEVERLVQGDAVAPLDLWRKLAKRFTLIGVQGDCAHGAGRIGYGCLGCPCHCRRRPACALHRRCAEAGFGVQQLRARSDGRSAGGSPTRRKGFSPAAFAPSSCVLAIPRCSRIARHCGRSASVSASVSA